MILAPKLPPGRANRKALAFNAEILRLRSLGYSFEAIRQALLAAGIAVSRSTVKREVVAERAHYKRVVTRPTSKLSKENTELPELRSPLTPGQGAVTFKSTHSVAARTGREIAEDFMKGRIANPLLQERKRK